MKPSPPEHPIIFFDGVCGICNTFVNIVRRADRKHIFRFAPLQGETARKMLPPLPDDPLTWSMIYLDEQGRIFDQSDASLQVYRRLGGPWWLLSLLRFIPLAIRTPAYRFIARSRYKWFAKRDTCRVPTEKEQAVFLP